MIHVMFICHGNICRSPMAEFVFRNQVEQRGLSDYLVIASTATSREEIGNPVHRGTVKKLSEMGIGCSGKVAVQLKPSDYDTYDFLVCMDSANVKNTLRIVTTDPLSKIRRLLDFTDKPGDIADPWYTGNFDETYKDVVVGCEALLNHILRHSAGSLNVVKNLR